MINQTARPETRQWRMGFCDSLMSRPCDCPYPEHHRAAEYLAGYLAGDDARKRHGIPRAE